MKPGLYKSKHSEYPFFKVRGNKGLWVGYHEGEGDPTYRINQKSEYWLLPTKGHYDLDIEKTPIAPLLMTEWQK